MGNIETQNCRTVDQNLRDYQQIRKENDGIVLTDKNKENTYFLKQSTFVDKKHYERQLQRLRNLQKEQPSENLLNIVKVSNREFNNFCSNSYKIYTVYEYPSITLEDQIEARSKQQKYFQECQLWSILQSCANGISEIKPALSLHPRSVFVVPDGVLKVICNDMVQQDYRCILKSDVYYAPQKIRNFHKTSNEISVRKEGVFSLGMTILHASLLKPINDCYKYDKYEFIDDKLEEHIEQLVNLKYTEQFIEVLAMILQPNPNKRASLMEVHGMLTKIWNAETEQNQQEQQQKSNIQQEQQDQSSVNSAQKQEVVETKNNEIANKNSQNNTKIWQKQQSIHDLQNKSVFSQKPSMIEYSHNNSYAFHPYQPIDTYLPSINKQNLYTDPKLLDMIKKDLQDIGELKKSSMLNTFVPYNNVLGNTSLYNHNYMNNYSYSNVGSINGSFTGQVLKNSEIQSNMSVNHSYRQSLANLGINYKISQKPSKQISPAKQMRKVEMNEFNKIKQNKKQSEAKFFVEEYQDGRKFEGHVLNGIKEGFGKLTYTDGAFYEGNFSNDRMEGKGTLYYLPGKPAYDGEWLSDQFHGCGILYNENPLELNGSFNYNDFNMIQDFWVRYEGFFDSDNKAGEGRLILSNGQQFHGNFENDTISGKGVFIARCSNQEIEEIHGIWEDNALVQLLQDA